jgi:hypothetical protein
MGLTFLMALGVSSDNWLIGYPLFIALIVLCAYPTFCFAEEPFMRLRESKVPQRSLFIPLWKASVYAIRTHVFQPVAIALHLMPRPVQLPVSR